MSKKSYKRNQNRLYREIKRRIIAEKRLLNPVRFAKCERKIETLKIRHIIPDYINNKKDAVEFAISDMARKMAQTLVDDGYIKFNYFGKYVRLADDEEVKDISEIEARLDVVKPWN